MTMKKTVIARSERVCVSDAAIQLRGVRRAYESYDALTRFLDCFASLAMTMVFVANIFPNSQLPTPNSQPPTPNP